MFKRLSPTIRKRFARQNWYDKQILCWGAPESDQRAFLIAHIGRRRCIA
jgi:hypothetical protein